MQDLPRPLGGPRGSNPGHEKLRRRKKNFRSAHYGECFAQTLFLQGTWETQRLSRWKVLRCSHCHSRLFSIRLTCLLGLEAKFSSREASNWTRSGLRWTGTRSGFPVGPRLTPDPVQLPSRNRLDSRWFPDPTRERVPPEKFENSWHVTRKLLSWEEGLTHHLQESIVNFSTWYSGIYKTAHRIWLRILSIAFEKELKVLDYS